MLRTIVLPIAEWTYHHRINIDKAMLIMYRFVVIETLFNMAAWYQHIVSTSLSFQYKYLMLFQKQIFYVVTLIFGVEIRLAPMWQQSGTLIFCSCHGIAGFLVDELQI